jgi:hypothetical protein
MSGQLQTPQPTPEELKYVRSRSLARTFSGWTETQRAIYLAVFRGHTRRGAIATYLGMDADRVAAELEGMSGDLLWDRSQPDPAIHLRD